MKKYLPNSIAVMFLVSCVGVLFFSYGEKIQPEGPFADIINNTFGPFAFFTVFISTMAVAFMIGFVLFHYQKWLDR